MQLPSHFTPTHETSGLPGYPAVDLFAHAGEPVYAAANATVTKLSGRAPTATAKPGGPYGWSVYLRPRVGPITGEHPPAHPPAAEDYVTHLGTRAPLKVGQRIRRGQRIGTVADYAKATHGVTPSHIHLGRHVP